jgi:hypothetical protein
LQYYCAQVLGTVIRRPTSAWLWQREGMQRRETMVGNGGRSLCCIRLTGTGGTEYGSLALLAFGTCIDLLGGWEINLYHCEDNVTSCRVNIQFRNIDLEQSKSLAQLRVQHPDG